MKKGLLLIIIFSLITLIFYVFPCRASIAVIPLEKLVKRSEIIVIGTVNYQYLSTDTEYENMQITINILSVEKVIKGDPHIKEVRLRTINVPSGIPGPRFPLELNDRILVPLSDYRKEDNTYEFAGASDELMIYKRINPSSPIPVPETTINAIVEVMRDNNMPVSLPLREQISYPFFAPYGIGSFLLVLIIFLFGISVLAINIFRIRNQLPSFITEKRWNLVDWYWTITWVLSLIYAIFIWVTLSYLWWIGLSTIAVFWGGTSYFFIQRVLKIARKE